MLLEYVGPKPLPFRVETPIPFLSRSDHQGQLLFTPTCEVPNEQWATFLLTQCGAAFKSLETKKPTSAPITVAEPQKSHEGKRFLGKAAKAQAINFLRRHKLGDTLGIKKKQIGDTVMHWELVPLAQADLTVDTAPRQGRPPSVSSVTKEGEPPIPAQAEGPKE